MPYVKEEHHLNQQANVMVICDSYKNGFNFLMLSYNINYLGTGIQIYSQIAFTKNGENMT